MRRANARRNLEGDGEDIDSTVHGAGSGGGEGREGRGETEEGSGTWPVTRRRKVPR